MTKQQKKIIKDRKRKNESIATAQMSPDAYLKRKADRQARVRRIEARVKQASKAAKERIIKIIDNKGKEHRIGEIFESNTFTLEI